MAARGAGRGAWQRRERPSKKCLPSQPASGPPEPPEGAAGRGGRRGETTDHRSTGHRAGPSAAANAASSGRRPQRAGGRSHQSSRLRLPAPRRGSCRHEARRGRARGGPAAPAKPKAAPEQSKGNQSASGGSPQRSGWGGGAAGVARTAGARSEARAMPGGRRSRGAARMGGSGQARPGGGGAGAGAPAQEAPGVAKKRRGQTPAGV